MITDKILNEFQKKYGCLQSVDWKNRIIYIGEGSLFALETQKKKIPKLIGFKPIFVYKTKCYEGIFSKKKYSTNLHTLSLWFEEVDETICWFKSLKKMLIKQGYKTSYGRAKLK